MKIKELKKLLIDKKIDSKRYVINLPEIEFNKTIVDRAYVIREINGDWVTYIYYKWDSLNNFKYFSNEDEACTYFYDWINKSIR